MGKLFNFKLSMDNEPIIKANADSLEEIDEKFKIALKKFGVKKR